MSKQVGEWDLDIVQGATFREPITWKVGETKDTVAPVDLTDYIARLQIRTSYAAAETILSISTDTGHITLGGVYGTIEILISDEETAALSVDDFRSPAYWDLELESAGGDVKRLLKGRVGLDPEVTREETS